MILDRSDPLPASPKSTTKKSVNNKTSNVDLGEVPEGRRGSVWFYDLTADGFSLDDKRTEIQANDIPDLLAKWSGREEGANSYRVPIAKILESEDRSLAAGRYKPVTAQAANHDTPQDILNEVLSLEDEIAKKAKDLLKAIK